MITCLQMAAILVPAKPTALGALPLGGLDLHAPTPPSRHLSPLHSEKTAASGAGSTDAAPAPSRTGKGRHGQGIANDPHTNAVAKKAEDAAAQAGAKELKAMRADKAKAQREADARHARSLCMRAVDALTDQIRSGGRAV
jgi:hypothetical protein